jgi:hypothetical protein
VAEHTAKPWAVHVFAYKDVRIVQRANDEVRATICTMSNGSSEHMPEQAANASLIATAPELLEALEKICAEAKSWHTMHGHEKDAVQCDSICDLIPQMQTAIQKARGETERG